MDQIRIKPHYCHGLEHIKVGFVFSFPSLKNQTEGKPIDGMAEFQLNNLLCKLNRKFPELFPACTWQSYRITNAYTVMIKNNGKCLHDLELISQDHNLTRIKDEIDQLELLICFGEKAYFAMNKTIKKFGLNLKVIKVMSLNNSSLSRSNRLKQDAPRIRTNYRILEMYKEIVNEIER